MQRVTTFVGMTTRLTFAVLLSASLNLPGMTQVILQLTPAADASLGIHPGYPTENQNYGSAAHLATTSQQAVQGINNGRGVMRFDLSSIPAGSTVLGAFLDFTGCGPFGTGDVGSVGHVGQNQSYLKRIIELWEESTVTWNNQPATTDLNAVILPVSTYSAQNYLNIDLTQLIQDMVDNPATSFGFLFGLVNESVTRGMAFYSSDSANPDHWPALTIVYGECEGVNGVTENIAPASFTLFPSIARNSGHIILSASSQTTGVQDVEVVDTSGRVVLVYAATQWPLQIFTDALMSGSYSVQVRDRTKALLFSARFVVVH